MKPGQTYKQGVHKKQAPQAFFSLSEESTLRTCLHSADFLNPSSPVKASPEERIHRLSSAEEQVGSEQSILIRTSPPQSLQTLSVSAGAYLITGLLS